MIKWKYGLVSDGFTIGGCDSLAAGTEQIMRLYEIDKIIGGYHTYKIFDPKTKQYIYSTSTEKLEKPIEIKHFR